jgi:hypothetical protein
MIQASEMTPVGGRKSSGSELKGRKVQVETLGLLTRLLEPGEQSLLLFHLGGFGGEGNWEGSFLLCSHDSLCLLTLSHLFVLARPFLHQQCGAGAGVATAGVGSWREMDGRSIPPCASNTTLIQLPVARQSWYSSRMRDTVWPGGGGGWSSVEPCEGMVVILQLGWLLLEALGSPFMLPLHVLHPF